MNRYYSTLRPIGPGAFPTGVKIENLVNFDRRTYVDEIGREAWGYVDIKTTLSRKTQMSYDLVPVCGMTFARFADLFRGVLPQSDIERLERYSFYCYRGAHHVRKLADSDCALARLQLARHLYNVATGNDPVNGLIDFFEALKIPVDPYALAKRIIDSNLSTVIE